MPSGHGPAGKEDDGKIANCIGRHQPRKAVVAQEEREGEEGKEEENRKEKGVARSKTYRQSYFAVPFIFLSVS